MGKEETDLLLISKFSAPFFLLPPGESLSSQLLFDHRCLDDLDHNGWWFQRR